MKSALFPSSTPALVLAVTLSCGAHSRAAVVYVSQAAPGPAHDGASWATAFTTIGAGVAAAAAGDELWVAAARYVTVVEMKGGVGMYGGFGGTEVRRSQRDPSTNVTTIDATHYRPAVTLPADSTADTVVDGFSLVNGRVRVLGGEPVITNNTVQNEETDFSPGGGVSIDSGSPVIAFNTFRYCRADYFGGGVYVSSGTPVISNNIITNCSASTVDRGGLSYGGGIHVASGYPLISGNTITGCFAVFGGGISAADGLIRDNYITGNTAVNGYTNAGAGGGMYLDRGVAVHNLIEGNHMPGLYGGNAGAMCRNAVLVGNTFRNNDALGYAGSVLSCSGPCTILRNTFIQTAAPLTTDVRFSTGTFSNNLLVTVSGAGVVITGSSPTDQTLVVNNTLVHTGAWAGAPYPVAISSNCTNGERPVVANNIVSGWRSAGYNGTTTGIQPVFTTDHNDLFGNGDNSFQLPGASPVGVDGNISLDPQFADPANGNYRIQPGSPCIDAGNDAYIAAGDRDLNGAPRITGAHADIGAYEHGSPAWTMQDAARVLRISAGLAVSDPAETARLDVVQGSAEKPCLTVADATQIARWLLN